MFYQFRYYVFFSDRHTHIQSKFKLFPYVGVVIVLPCANSTGGFVSKNICVYSHACMFDVYRFISIMPRKYLAQIPYKNSLNLITLEFPEWQCRFVSLCGSNCLFPSRFLQIGNRA